MAAWTELKMRQERAKGWLKIQNRYSELIEKERHLTRKEGNDGAPAEKREKARQKSKLEKT